MKRIDELAHAARRARVRLNVFVTIRAPRGVSDAAGKRVISRAVAHLGRGLQRRGQPHHGVTVYEKAPDLHGHHLVHVRPENDDVVARWADGEDRDARPADAVAVAYVTKQRQRLPPDRERAMKRRWVSSAAIAGPRWTMTKAARALLAVAEGSGSRASGLAPEGPEARPVQAASAPAASETIPEPTRSTLMQLDLFDDLPRHQELVPPDELRRLCAVNGLSQRQIGAMVGIKQPHVANVIRLHDKLSLRCQRAVRYLVETGRLAA